MRTHSSVPRKNPKKIQPFNYWNMKPDKKKSQYVPPKKGKKRKAKVSEDQREQ